MKIFLVPVLSFGHWIYISFMCDSVVCQISTNCHPLSRIWTFKRRHVARTGTYDWNESAFCILQLHSAFRIFERVISNWFHSQFSICNLARDDWQWIAEMNAIVPNWTFENSTQDVNTPAGVENFEECSYVCDVCMAWTTFIWHTWKSKTIYFE